MSALHVDALVWVASFLTTEGTEAVSYEDRGNRAATTAADTNNPTTPELSDLASRVYSFLLSQAVASEERDVWLTMEQMAQMIGRHRNRISQAIHKELAPLGLVEVRTVRYGDNNSRRRNVYIVREQGER